MAYPNVKQQNQELEKAFSYQVFIKNIVEDKKSGEYRLSHHFDFKTGF